MNTANDISTKAVEAIFADMRDRKFLKWLFKEEEAVIGDFVGLRSIDLVVQQEIRDTWAAIIATAIRNRQETEHG